MNELRKYEIEAMVMEELMKEQENSFKSHEDALDEARRTIAKVIKENEMASYDPDNGLSDKCKKTKHLTQIIQSMIWRIQDTTRETQDIGDDIQQLINSSSYAAIGAAISKLHNIWNSESDDVEKKEMSADPQKGDGIEVEKVVPGEEVKSNNGDMYKIESINEDVVFLTNKQGQLKTASIDVVKKWKKNNK